MLFAMPVLCECSLNQSFFWIIDDDMYWMGIMTSLRRYGVGSGQYTILLGALIFDHGMVNSEGKESIVSLLFHHVMECMRVIR